MVKIWLQSYGGREEFKGWRYVKSIGSGVCLKKCGKSRVNERSTRYSVFLEVFLNVLALNQAQAILAWDAMWKPIILHRRV